MQKQLRGKVFRVVVGILSIICLTLPASAQVQPGEEAAPEPLLRVAIVDVKVQGDQTPEVVREALTAVLPALGECFKAEYQRVGKVPTRIMLRFNLGGSGKVVWSKVVEPPLKSLDSCVSKVMLQIQLPRSGTTISRVTALLEAKLDHLLIP